MDNMVKKCSRSLRVVTALLSFIMIVLIASILPIPILQLESYGLVLLIIIGIIVGFLTYMNRSSLSAFIVTLMLVGGIAYHVVYLLRFKASLPESIIRENPSIYEYVSDYTLRASYVLIVFLVLIVAFIISLTVKHPLELVSFYISLIALLALTTSYAYISVPLLMISLSTIVLVKTKCLKGLLVFALVYSFILLPVSIAYHVVDYGLEKSSGDPVQGILYAMNYLCQSNYSIPLFTEVKISELISKDSLTSIEVLKLVTYHRFRAFTVKLDKFTSLTHHEIRSRLTSSLIPVAASSILFNHSTTIIIALMCMYSGLVAGALLAVYVDKIKPNIMIKVLGKSKNILALLLTSISLAILPIVFLWIGLILGVYFFNAMSSIGYYSTTLMNYNIILYSGLLLLAITTYPLYIFRSLKTLHHIGEDFRTKYLRIAETLLNRIGVLKTSILRVSGLARSMQVYLKNISEELSSIENEVTLNLSWLKHAKSIEIIQSNFNEYLDNTLRRCNALEVQLAEELGHILKLRKNMLVNALELTRELNIPIDLSDHIVKLDIDKTSIPKLLEILLTLNKYMVNVIRVLIEKYKELGESISLLGREDSKIQQDIEESINRIEESLSYDPYIATELILEKITMLNEVYYNKLLERWRKLRRKLLSIIRESREITEKNPFIEKQYKKTILEKIRLIEKYLGTEAEGLGNLSSHIVKIKVSLLELVNININILENEVLRITNTAQVDRLSVSKSLPIQLEYIAELNNRLKEISNNTKSSTLLELAELTRQLLTYLDQISAIREEFSSIPDIKEM